MKLNPILVRTLAPLIIASILVIPHAQNASAAMISTDQFLSGQSTGRERITALLEKDTVLKKLQEFGVSPLEAKERVASLTDAEVVKLNSKIDQIPAGADAGEAILGTAFAVFLILLITDILCLTKIFKFTRCAGGTT